MASGELKLQVSGSQPEVEAFREELLAHLRAEGVRRGVEVSAPEPLRHGLGGAPLGYEAWAQALITIATGVVSSVMAEALKLWIADRMRKHGLMAGGPKRGKQGSRARH